MDLDSDDWSDHNHHRVPVQAASVQAASPNSIPASPALNKEAPSAINAISSALEYPFKFHEDTDEFGTVEDPDLTPTLEDYALFYRFTLVSRESLENRLVLCATAALTLKDTVPDDVAFSYYQRARKAVMKYAHIPSVRTAQAFHYIFLFSLWKGQPSLGQPFFQRAIEMANDLRLNVDPDNSPWLHSLKLTEIQKEERRRVYWSLQYLSNYTKSISEDACQIECEPDASMKPPRALYDAEGSLVFPPNETHFATYNIPRLMTKIKRYYATAPKSIRDILFSPAMTELNALSIAIYSRISQLLIIERPDALTDRDYDLFMHQIQKASLDTQPRVITNSFNAFASTCMLHRSKMYLSALNSCHPFFMDDGERGIISLAIMESFEAAHRISGLLSFLNQVKSGPDAGKVAGVSGPRIVYALFESTIVFWFITCRMKDDWWEYLPPLALVLRGMTKERWETVARYIESENRLRSSGSLLPLLQCVGYMYREFLAKESGVVVDGVEELVLGMQVSSIKDPGESVTKDAWAFLGLLGLEVAGGVRWKGKSEEAWRLFWKLHN
ncbi:hypothetical protein HDU79_005651 [Rhizoclosmatium sp. JEL0117]|nr:hypothetical protein HDU79_005651 [Rhizoclosmatium sp. JEL0117]